MLTDEQWEKYRSDLAEIRAGMDQVSALVPLIFQSRTKADEREATLTRLRAEQYPPLGRVVTLLQTSEGDELAELYRLAGEQLYG
jgi:hypothetical protein